MPDGRVDHFDDDGCDNQCVSQRILPLDAPAILIAHGAMGAHPAADMVDAFRLALRLGADGVSSGLWATSDGVPVVGGSPTIGRGIRRRQIADTAASELPSHIVGFDELRAALGPAATLALAVGDRAAVAPALAAARQDGSLSQLWLTHDDDSVLEQIRAADRSVGLIWSTRLRRLSEGPERRAAMLRDRQINGIEMHYSDWTGGLTTLFHRFGRLTWASDTQHERSIREVLAAGIDGVMGPHPDRMVDAVRASPSG